MSYEEWKGRIVDCVRAISDEQYQRRSWFGVGPDVNSPDEMICEVFDDLNVPDFVLRYSSVLTKAELQTAHDFLAAFTAFADSTPPHLDPNVVFVDKRWKHIRTLAGRMLNEWRS